MEPSLKPKGILSSEEKASWYSAAGLRYRRPSLSVNLKFKVVSTCLSSELNPLIVSA